MNNIYAICYDTLYVFKNMNDAKKFFLFCANCSEGAEHERYTNILTDYYFSNIGRDNVTIDCNKINIRTNCLNDKSLTINLNKSISNDDIIKYYEEKIIPILQVSKEYDINFSSHIPFEDFGCDSDINMSSFSDYYKAIIEKVGLKINNIYTNEVSAGKYILIINDDFNIDIRAWDNLDSVIDNVETIIENLEKCKNNKDKSIEI